MAVTVPPEQSLFEGFFKIRLLQAWARSTRALTAGIIADALPLKLSPPEGLDPTWHEVHPDEAQNP